MRIWAIDQQIDEVEIELRSARQSKAEVSASLKHAWRDKLDVSAVSALMDRARACAQRERRLEGRLQTLLDRRQRRGLAVEPETRPPMAA